MIQPSTPNDLSSAGIEDIMLDDNKANVSPGANGFIGINLPDLALQLNLDRRTQFRVRNVFIYGIKGTAGAGNTRQNYVSRP